MHQKTFQAAAETVSRHAALAMLASAGLAAAILLSWLVIELDTTLIFVACFVLALAAAFSAFVILREFSGVPQNDDLHAAEQTSDEKLRLLAAMSHEIRTPLHGVVGMINLLLDTKLSPEQENYAKTANNSARTLLSIIDESLDTMKGQSKARQGHEPVAIRPLVEHVTELMSVRAHAKGIELSTYVSAVVPETAAVRDLALRQILFNLIGNAIKFTPAGHVGVEISAHGTSLAIQITDTGIGMTPGERERIFAEYSQANGETERRFGGTGLGLAITRTLVSELAGEITVESTQGLGTTFRVMLPDAVQGNATTRLQPLAGRHFFLAAEPTVSADHAKRMIADQGGEVTMVHGESRVRELLLRELRGSECMIADSVYADTLRKWAALQMRERPKVWVMLTAEDRRAMRDLLSAPFAGYLLKPFRLATLMDRLASDNPNVLRKTATDLRQATKARVRRSEQHILIADDNPVNRLLVSTMLGNMGHKVTQVESGIEVLELFSNGQRFDALLLDIEMPGLDGYETALRLRKAENLRSTPRLPIFALTAHRRKEELEKCLACGMNGHLTKPFDQHDLDEALAQLQPAA